MGLDCAAVTPQRLCIGCRRSDAKSALVRLVINPVDATLQLDWAQRLPGRGCYLHPQCVSVVIRNHGVGRAFRRSIDPAQVAAVLNPLKAD
jgi:uncharacterized protein